MSKNLRLIIVVIIITLLAIVALIISMSYNGGTQFNWFAGFKMNSGKARDSIALGTWSFILVGSGLSIAGFAMQSLTRNQLASAYSLGTIAGGSLALVLVKYIIAPESWFVEILLDFIIMFLISTVTLALTLANKIDNYKIIVIGINISVLISSITYILRFTKGLNAAMIGFLSLSTLHYTWRIFWVAMPVITLASLWLILQARKLQIYHALPEKHFNLGIKKTRIKLAIAIPTIFISIAAVLLIGPISFVGIIIPHITRRFFKRAPLLLKMVMNVPIAIVILLTANLIWTATFSYGTNINVLLGILTAPLIISWILRSKDV